MSYRPAGCGAIDRTGRTIRRRGTWFRTDASAAKTTVIVPAMKRNISEGPPLSSAHAPAYGDTTPPMRPIATAVPTPVARMPVGYTCAARAYIVVCTALMRPPVHACMARTDTTGCAAIATDASSTAPATAPAAIVSMVSREPSRAMVIAPSIAPTTPPRLYAVKPLLATATLKPAPVNSDGTQVVPMYTVSRQKKYDAHSAS